MRLIVLILAMFLSSCAFVQTHIAQIALVGTVAGTVAATESAMINAIVLERELTK